MNKIKSLFKASPIAVIAVALLVAGVASAGLVNYLSDYTTTTATVTSPIEMKVHTGANADWDTGVSSIDITTTGGSDFTFTTIAKNSANNTIEGYPVIVVEAPANQPFIGGEIAKVLFRDENGGPHDITNMLYVVHSNGAFTALSSWTGSSQKLVLFFNNGVGTPFTDGYPIDAGAVNWNVLTLTPNAAIAPGIYNIYSQYANNLAEYATEQYNK